MTRTDRDARQDISYHFRLAAPADAAALSAFARDIFIRTFGPDNDPADTDAYAAGAFSTAQQASEIAEPGSFTLLAVNDADAILAYAHVAPGPPDRVTVGDAPIEIKRFYVAHHQHGRGLARALMDAVFDQARQLGARTVWLGVWERNPRAIAFYHKLDFEQAGTQPFMLGNDLQTDWVMQNTTSLR